LILQHFFFISVCT